MSELFVNTPVKAIRKKRRCAWCGESMQVGEPAVKNSQVFEGEFNCFYLHPECSKALDESDFNEIMDGWQPWEQKRGKPYSWQD